MTVTIQSTIFPLQPIRFRVGSGCDATSAVV